MQRLDPTLHRCEFIFLIAGQMALTALSVDITLPALDEITAAHALSDANRAQLIVTIFTLGLAIGQFFFGPISDILGRRAVMITGLALYALASVLCLFSNSFEVLLFGRFLQGIGGAAPRIVALAMLRDSYDGKRLGETVSLVMAIFVILPVIAPSIGAGIMLVGAWRLIFVFLALYGVVFTGWALLRLPETHSNDRRSPASVGWFGGALVSIFRSRQTVGYTLAMGMSFGAFLSYVASAEQIYTEIYGYEAAFPLLFGAAAIGMTMASLISARLVIRYGARRIAHSAHLGLLVTALVFWFVVAQGTAAFGVFWVSMALAMFFVAFLFSGYSALAIEPMGHIAGTASSFIGAISTVIAAVIATVIAGAYEGTLLPFAQGFAIAVVAGAGLVLFVERGKLFDRH